MRRKMFSMNIVGTDTFLDMPVSTRDLYFYLNMNADDDGFIQPKKIVRMIGASEDDLRLLLAKGYLIIFDSGVTVVADWLIHNQIRKDRYQPTIYQYELSLLQVANLERYVILATKWQPVVADSAPPGIGIGFNNNKKLPSEKTNPEMQEPMHKEKKEEIRQGREKLTKKLSIK